MRNGIVDVVQRPGISDLICLGLLLVASLAGTVLEPSYRDFWLGLPLLVEVPLLCTALLLLSRSKIAARIAAFIHLAILAGSGLLLVLSAFLLVTILFAGTAVILGPFSVLVALNSAYTLSIIRTRNRVASTGASTS